MAGGGKGAVSSDRGRGSINRANAAQVSGSNGIGIRGDEHRTHGLNKEQ